jgi:cyclopropane fatty-acyl-phospholipid synthase-like methyltransferase
MSTAPFDPVAYKRTTTEQWQTAAEPWHRWGPTLEAWLGEATETMLDMAGVARTARVLDVAAGAGGQTLAAARRVGPDGRVLATDISSNILAFAERSAHEAGLHNVETRVVDGERLDVQPGTFDAVISRVGAPPAGARHPRPEKWRRRESNPRPQSRKRWRLRA